MKERASSSPLPSPPAHPSSALLPVNAVTEDGSLLTQDAVLPPSWSRTKLVVCTFITSHHRLVPSAEPRGCRVCSQQRHLLQEQSTSLTQRSHFYQQVTGVKHLQIFTCPMEKEHRHNDSLSKVNYH